MHFAAEMKLIVLCILRDDCRPCIVTCLVFFVAVFLSDCVRWGVGGYVSVRWQGIIYRLLVSTGIFIVCIMSLYLLSCHTTDFI